MMNNLHPLFQNILAAHGATAYQAALSDEVTIRVPRVEVALCDGNPRDPDAHWHCGYLNEEQTQRLYELLLEDTAVAIKAELIAEKLGRGEVA